MYTYAPVPKSWGGAESWRGRIPGRVCAVILHFPDKEVESLFLYVYDPTHCLSTFEKPIQVFCIFFNWVISFTDLKEFFTYT